MWQGYYQEAGLDVKTIPDSPNKPPHTEVLAERAQYGVKFLALLTNEGVNLQDVEIIPSSFRIDDLIEGKVDAFNAYLSNEPFYLQDQGIKPHIINPVDYGVDMYSDILFNSQQEAKLHPKRLTAFLDASLKSWEYALTHQQEQMQALAFENPLTHLHNRRSLIKRLNLSIRNCKHKNLFGALLFMDLDDFKPINDKYRHTIGDLLLQKSALRLKNSVRQNDAIFRIGGDEFVIQLSHFETKEQSDAERNALNVAKNLLDKLRVPYQVENIELNIAASIGVKVFHDGSEDADKIITQADHGMYEAKKQSKNQFKLI